MGDSNGANLVQKDSRRKNFCKTSAIVVFSEVSSTHIVPIATQIGVIALHIGAMSIAIRVMSVGVGAI